MFPCVLSRLRWLLAMLTTGILMVIVVLGGIGALMLCFIVVPKWVANSLGYQVAWSCPEFEGLCAPVVAESFWIDKLVFLSRFLACGLLMLIGYLLVMVVGAVAGWWRSKFSGSRHGTHGATP